MRAEGSGSRAPTPTQAPAARSSPGPLMDDATLLAAFEARTLPFVEWRHATHIRVAHCYLTRHPFDEAVRRMRAGIQAYNQANAVPEGPLMGYHETITQAWLQIVAVTIREQGAGADSADFLAQQPHLGHRTLLRCFYSKARIMSPEAKGGFVQPDLAPLPR